jgi:site-specific recombinase XerD
MTDEVVRSYADSNRELIESFVRYMQARNLAESTMVSYRNTVERLLELIGSATVIGAKRSDIHNFLARLFRKELNPATINKHTAGLRAFFKFLRMAGLIEFDPMDLIPHRKLPKRLPRVLTVEEVDRIIVAANDPAERAIIETLYATGVRISELVNIRLENVMFAEHMILVERGKGDKDRWVLFGRRAALAIQEYLRLRPSECGYLFEAPPGNALGSWDSAKRPQRPYTKRAIHLMVQRMAARAQVKGVHPHSFRRAFACHMLAHGADIRAIQELMGHTNLSTTMIYTTLTDEKLQEIHSKFHPHGEANDVEKD